MFRDEMNGQFINPQRRAVGYCGRGGLPSQYHPDDLILDEPDHLDPSELWALTGHGLADLREWDQ